MIKRDSVVVTYLIRQKQMQTLFNEWVRWSELTEVNCMALNVSGKRCYSNLLHASSPQGLKLSYDLSTGCSNFHIILIHFKIYIVCMFLFPISWVYLKCTGLHLSYAVFSSGQVQHAFDVIRDLFLLSLLGVIINDSQSVVCVRV